MHEVKWVFEYVLMYELIAGKGHENYQILKTGTIHFDDKEVAIEAIRGMLW